MKTELIKHIGATIWDVCKHCPIRFCLACSSYFDSRIQKNDKEKFDSETYNKMGHPDLGCKMYMMKAGKKVWGTVSLLSFCGFRGAKKGLVLLGLEPYKR